MAFASLTIDLTAKIAQFEENMNRATKGVDKLNSRASALATGFKAAFGAGAAVGLISIAKQGIDAADALNDMSQRTGVAVRALAEYQLAATQADTSLDGLARGIQKLTLSIGQAEQGSDEQAAALQRLGVTARDPKQAFEQLADSVAKSNDPIKINADLQKVLGKSYADLLPLLQGGANGLRESAMASATFAEQMAKLAPDAAKFNNQLDLLKLNAAGAAAAMLNELVPSINEFFERIRLLKDLIDSGGVFNTLVVTAGTDDIEEVMRRVRSEIELTREAIEGKKSFGADPSAFEEKLRGLNAQLQVLIENRTKALMAPPKNTSLKGIQDAAADTAIVLNAHADKIQEALRKAFNTTPMDKFVEQFKERRKKIAEEYERLNADISGRSTVNSSGVLTRSDVTGIDFKAELSKGRGSLSRGDIEGANTAATGAKAIFSALIGKESTASFEKTYYSRELQAFENSIVDVSERAAQKVNGDIKDKFEGLLRDGANLKVKVDSTSIASQVKEAVEQAARDLQSNPLKIPIVGIPSLSSAGRQSVDISAAALQYGGRR